MRIKALALVFALMYLPWSLYLLYRILTIIEADELTWFIYWLLVPMAFVSVILTKLAEWEKND